MGNTGTYLATAVQKFTVQQNSTEQASQAAPRPGHCGDPGWFSCTVYISMVAQPRELRASLKEGCSPSAGREGAVDLRASCKPGTGQQSPSRERKKKRKTERERDRGRPLPSVPGQALPGSHTDFWKVCPQTWGFPESRGLLKDDASELSPDERPPGRGEEEEGSVVGTAAAALPRWWW